jgi:membrane protease YdiL (CAAX protease family)
MTPVGPAPHLRVQAPDGTLGRRALVLVAVAIGMGAVATGVSWALSRDTSMEPDTYIRYAIVITLALYAVVAALIVTQITPSVRLRWRVGDPLPGVALGVVVGGGASMLLLALVSGASGHLNPDPRIVTMMSEGDVAHILTAVLISCACAPLVEEVLFRGLLLESLRRHGTQAAVIGSGIAFAVWHLNPAALRYYALMGAMLGVLYVKRGLVASIAAHVAFNGVLTVAAIAVVLAPTKTVTAGGVSISEPGGWSQSTASVAALTLRGPSGAWLGVLAVPTPTAPDLDQVVQRLGDGNIASAYPDLEIDTASTRRVTLPAGEAVEVDIAAHGHHGTMVFLPAAGRSFEVMFLSGGSVKAASDFTRMLPTLRVG